MLVVVVVVVVVWKMKLAAFLTSSIIIKVMTIISPRKIVVEPADKLETATLLSSGPLESQFSWNNPTRQIDGRRAKLN